MAVLKLHGPTIRVGAAKARILGIMRCRTDYLVGMTFAPVKPASNYLVEHCSLVSLAWDLLQAVGDFANSAAARFPTVTLRPGHQWGLQFSDGTFDLQPDLLTAGVAPI